MFSYANSNVISNMENIIQREMNRSNIYKRATHKPSSIFARNLMRVRLSIRCSSIIENETNRCVCECIINKKEKKTYINDVTISISIYDNIFINRSIITIEIFEQSQKPMM